MTGFWSFFSFTEKRNYEKGVYIVLHSYIISIRNTQTKQRELVIMTNEQFEAIMEVKRAMENNGIMGVQFMKLEGEIATFEAFGRNNEEYVNYLVDIDAVVEGDMEITRETILVEDYDGEIDVTINITTYNERMEQIDFHDELVKTYKREASAIKKAKALCKERGTNWEISNC
jgi:hypothetical protein